MLLIERRVAMNEALEVFILLLSVVGVHQWSGRTHMWVHILSKLLSVRILGQREWTFWNFRGCAWVRQAKVRNLRGQGNVIIRRDKILVGSELIRIVALPAQSSFLDWGQVTRAYLGTVVSGINSFNLIFALSIVLLRHGIIIKHDDHFMELRELWEKEYFWDLNSLSFICPLLFIGGIRELDCWISGFLFFMGGKVLSFKGSSQVLPMFNCYLLSLEM